jgi:hypothetical protein
MAEKLDAGRFLFGAAFQGMMRPQVHFSGGTDLYIHDAIVSAVPIVPKYHKTISIRLVGCSHYTRVGT